MNLLNFYEIEAQEDEIELKLKERNLKEKLFLITVPVLYVALLIVGIVVTILKKYHAHLIIFACTLLLLLYITITITKTEIKRRKVFKFIINFQGITHNDIDKTYFISWDEIISFGEVNYNPTSRRERNKDNTQTCYYFAKTIYDETLLRKKLENINLKRYQHCSNNEMIVLGLLEEDNEGKFYEFLSKYIYKYCDKNKEKSYILPMCPWI